MEALPKETILGMLTSLFPGMTDTTARLVFREMAYAKELVAMDGAQVHSLTLEDE